MLTGTCFAKLPRQIDIFVLERLSTIPALSSGLRVDGNQRIGGSGRPVETHRGNANGVVATDASELFSGVFDETCVFKRALTAAEVTTLNTTNCAGGSGGGVVSKRAYTYNPDSSVQSTTITQPGNTAAGLYQYTYDRGARLRSVTAPNAVVTVYTYDAAGNRTTAGASSFFYDQRNRLMSGAGTTYNWTPRGTLASTTGTGAATYAHDGLDRLTQAGTVGYAYDSLDRVTTRTVASVATPFSYAGVEKDPVAEGTSTKYLRGPSGQSVHGIIRGGTMTFAGADRHGDVSFTLSTTGAVVDTKVSDPFGKPLGVTGSNPNIGFQSDYTDPANGLVWMGARWYNPNTGTFTARDTMPGSVGAYATMNRYTYGLNNPLKYADPTGRYNIDMTPGGGAYPTQIVDPPDDGWFDDSLNGRTQRGERDATVLIYDDADGNPVFVVVTDIGSVISTATTTVWTSFDSSNPRTTTSSSPTIAGAEAPAGRPASFGDGRQGFVDSQGNCYKDENGSLLPKGDRQIYECLDMSPAEKEKARKKAKEKPENNPKPISPDLSANQWISVVGQAARAIGQEKQANRKRDTLGSAFGTCSGGGAALFFGFEAQECATWVAGELVRTKSIGYSIGLQASVGIGEAGLVSNAKTAEELLG